MVLWAGATDGASAAPMPVVDRRFGASGGSFRFRGGGGPCLFGRLLPCFISHELLSTRRQESREGQGTATRTDRGSPGLLGRKLEDVVRASEEMRTSSPEIEAERMTSPSRCV